MNRLIVILTISLSIISCTKNNPQKDGKVELNLNASSESAWCAGDKVQYYSVASGEISSLTVGQSGTATDMKFLVGKDDSFLAAVAGPVGIITHTASNILLNKAIQTTQDGTFAGAHLAVAKTSDLQSGSIQFKDVAAMVKFSFKRNDIASIIFTANGGAKIHDGGFAKISFTASDVTVSAADTKGGSSISVTTGGSGTFYMAALPSEFDGYEIQCLNTFGLVMGEVESSQHVSLSRNTVLDLGELDSKIKEVTPTDPRKAVADSAVAAIFKKTWSTGMSVAVVSEDRIIYEQSFGKKDWETNTELDTNSIYRIASISKTFISAALMQLVEQGKVGLDDDVNDILGFTVRHPQYPSVPITVRMLMTHSAGIEDGSLSYRTIEYLDPSKTDSATMVKNKVYLDGVMPGTAYNYTNRGANLCAAVVEKVSGIRLDEYYRTKLLEPLGIFDSGLFSHKLKESDMVTLYKGYKGGSSDEYTTRYDSKSVAYLGGDPDTLNYTLGYDTFGLNPSGSMVMSIRSLAQWMIMFKNKGVGANGTRVLSEASIAAIETPSTCNSNYGFYNMLNRTSTIAGCNLYGHNGSAYGLVSRLVYDRNKNFGMVALVSGTDTDQQTLGAPSIYVDSFRKLYEIYFQ